MNISDPQAYGEILMRLGAAAIAGAILGTDRDLNEKPAGMRTLSLVSLGSALIAMLGVDDLAHPSAADERSARMIQGIFAGIGFLGGGVILHHKAQNVVLGLTTAATIWTSAAVGVGCGLGLWIPAAIGLTLAVIILVPGVWLEHFVVTRFRRPPRPREKHPSSDDR